jgi:hypothetical protein
MRTYIRAVGISVVFLAAPLFAAADSVPVVNVSDACSVQDMSAVVHTFPQSGSPSGHLGICALAAALSQGAISDYDLQDFSFGLFVQGLNGTQAGSEEFWELFKNSVSASVGLSDMTVQTGDILTFKLTNWMTSTVVGTPVSFQIGALSSSAPSAPQPASGGIETIRPDFDASKAIIFLKSHQAADGSLPNIMLSDWAAFAFAAHRIGDGYDRLRAYMLSARPSLSSVTDYERHAMALMALGIDPYRGTPTDYIAPIVQSFDGAQFGEPSLVNDDIFALFPLLNAGYRTDEPMIRATLEFIIGRQRTNGSWEDSVDLTASVVQALALFPRGENIDRALKRADWYLSTAQKDDGGFGNSFSTAWTLQAIAAIADSHTVWAKNVYYTPRYYLAGLQESDGGVEKKDADAHMRIWATAYAVPGVLGRTWDSLLGEFPKPSSSAAPAPATAPAPEEEVRTESPLPASVAETVNPSDALVQQAASAELGSGALTSWWQAWSSFFRTIF